MKAKTFLSKTNKTLIIQTMQINKSNFYAKIRKSFGALKQSQVEGFEAFINEWHSQQLTDVRWLAYIFATVWHETNKTMQPIEEYGKGKGLKYGKQASNGIVYYGRGHTQNTWETNYIKLTKASPIYDFHNKPELLLQMNPSIWATFYAMKTGLYTGKKLSDYFGGVNDNPIGARKIINGTDKAELISGYYKSFLEALV